MSSTDVHTIANSVAHTYRVLAHSIDKNGNGELETSELSAALRAIKRRYESDEKDAQVLSEQISALKAKLERLEVFMDGATVATNAFLDAEAELIAHRALLHTDAKIGKPLAAKIRTAKNPKAVLTIEDVISQWDISRKVEGE